MRKAISMLVLLAFGNSLWANDNAQDVRDRDNQRPKIAVEKRHTATRTESYLLYMEDSYGDGWNGASLDLTVNGVVVGDDLTILTTDNAGDYNEFTFDVEVGDVVATVWTTGSYDNECYYGFYDAAGNLVAQAGTSEQPDLEVSFTVTPPPLKAWFSEYAEGSSNNKYLEIYNGSEGTINLDELVILGNYNGNDWSETFTFAAGATLAAGEVYVLANESLDASVITEADETFAYGDPWYITSFNGDDVRALAMASDPTNQILDIIGTLDGDGDGVPGEGSEDDPGGGFDVAGVSEATKDHTLQRKPTTMGNEGDWNGSAGTDADDSEWIVLEQNDWTGIGSHTNATPCDGNEYVVTVDGGSWQAEVSWEIVDAAGTIVLSGGAPITVADGLTACLANSGTNGYYLNLYDSFGDGWNGNVFTLWTAEDSDGDGVLEYTEYFSATLEGGETAQAYIPGTDDVYGCTDPEANNYDPNATIEDGSCTYDEVPCDANEYVVTVDGGSWQAEVSWEIVDAAGTVVLSGGAPITVADDVTACLMNSGTNGYYLNLYDSYGDGWNGNVFTLWTAADSDGDGVLEYTEYFSATLESGETAQAYIPGTDDVFGCMDPTATNYDPNATVDDGSCTYGCDDNQYVVTVDGGSWQSEVSWEIVDAAGAVVLTGGAPVTVDDNVTACLANSGTNGYYLNLYDSYGDGWNGNVFTLWTAADSDGDGVLEYTEYFSATLESGSAGQAYIPGTDDVLGCTDPTATNYDPAATVDDGSCIPSVITNLTASAGIQSVLLNWSPLAPQGGASLAVGSDNSDGFASMEEWQEFQNEKYAKDPSSNSSAWVGKTRSELLEHINQMGHTTRETEVLVTLYDSWGDGTPADVYLKDANGTVLQTLAGGWTGTEAAFGPFTLDDGQYDLEWELGVDSWLDEQSAEITLVSDGSVVGSGASPTFCFTLGTGFACSEADLTVTAVSYDPMTGLASATIANTGELDVLGNFFAVGFLEDPDMTQEFPPGWYCFAAVAGLAAGESVDVVLSGGSILPDITGGYDDATYTIYVAADGNGQLVPESDETNNVASLEVVNSNPLADVTFNIWRDYTEGMDPTASISGAGFIPGGLLEYLDVDVTSGTQYCYLVTQAEGTTESDPSNEACATPSAPPVVPGPSDLTGTASGFNVSLSWTAPVFEEGSLGEGLGTPSSTRQGGDDISTATVLTELTQQLGTNVGYFDDYEEDCGSGPSTSGDVVYSFTPTELVAVDLSTCYSDYDTKIFVYENTEGNLASTVAGGPASACSDDDYWPGETDEAPCTEWTSYINGLLMEPGNTYYIVLDGWGGDEGNYVLDFYPYDPLLGYTVWNMTSTGEYIPVGQAPADETEWSTVLFAAEPTDLNLAVTATYGLPGIFQLVNSDPAGPVALTIGLEDNPNNLTAMDYGDDVHLMWDPPVDASQMELSYHDGTMVNAYNHSGVVATRFRVSGTYAINGLANAYWTGGWPDATLGEVPITLSIHPVDPATDMPGEAIYAEEVYVDADPLSDTYGLAMTTGLADNPLVVTGDVYFAFSNFTNDAGTDTDVMGCDAVLDFPGNRYSNLGNGWELDVLSGSFANCGDWIMYMHADFTAGDVGLVSAGNNGQWIDQSGASSIANLPADFAGMEAASTKENLVELEYPAVSNPLFASHSTDRDMMHYNIYRDGEVVGNQQPGVHEYMDGGLDWGTYTFHVTAMYDDHESIATNSVEVTLSNVPPDAVMLISPGDGLEVEVTEDNMEETVAFIWTAANDADNDLVEYYLGAWTEVAAGDTAWNVLPDTPIENESFEEATQQDAPNDWQYLPDGWEGFPNQNSQTVQFTGDGIFGSEDLFEAYDGDASVKLWGLYDGNNTENNIFQTWYDGMLAPGTEFSVEAAVMSHAADWIGNGGNSLVLFAKYFTADWGWVGMDASMPFNGNYEASEWHYLEMDAVVPEGASTVQVGAMLIQPTPDDHGSVYMDDFYMHIPMTTTGLFVSYGDLADGMLEAGVSDLTWTWDIWASDGFEFTPSMSGPRELHVNISNLLGLENVSLPKEFALHNNYPNPFNPVTNIVYDIPEATDVTLEIYNVMGQRVRTLAQGNHEPGRYQIVWNATNDIGQALSSGMYIYRIQAGDFVSIKKLVLMK